MKATEAIGSSSEPPHEQVESRPVIKSQTRLERPVFGSRSAFERRLNLIVEMAVTQFRLKYTGSVLGYVWSLMKPLMIFAIMYIVFSKLLRVGNGSPNFALQLLVAVVLWQFFAETTAVGLQAIVGNANLIRKAYFPRGSLLVAATLTSFMTLAINLALIVLVFLPLGRLDVSWRTLLFLPLIAELYLLALGASLVLSTLYVFFRDVAYIWEVTTQVLFYGSAVVYPLGFVPASIQRFIVLNPMAQIIEDIRHVLVTHRVPWAGSVLGPLWFAPLLIAALIMLVGWSAFKRWAPMFAENL